MLPAASGCRTDSERQDVRPLVLRDVPAQRLAYRFEPDSGAPPEILNVEPVERLASIVSDFDTRRTDEALLRTVTSPDGQRALALYNTEDESRSAFRIDLYSADGKFLRNLIPPDISCVFPEVVAWSSDGNFITFIAQKKVLPSPSPTQTPPEGVTPPRETEASPSPSIAPIFPQVASFNTEQIYICNRDGFDLKPLTSREGLIYFYFSWAPDNHALIAMACKEDEWAAREKSFRLPAGRPRLIGLDGQERLLDDQLTDCLPVWSPDSSKVATAFEMDVAIYDAATNRPTQARIRLGDALLKASFAYREKQASERSDQKAGESGQRSQPQSSTGSQGQSTATSQSAATPTPDEEGKSTTGIPPASFNPFMHLAWPSPETIYAQTAFVRIYPSESINTFQRWHRLTLSPQAAVLR